MSLLDRARRWFYRDAPQQLPLTPDGMRYTAAATQRVARPFHYRWLIPRICKTDGKRWWLQSQLSTYALLPLIYWYVGGGWRGLAAAAMVPALSGVWKFNRKWPVLVDAPGMVCALLAADLMQHNLLPLGLLVALVGGCVRETSPVFAALYAWNPIGLIGLVPVAIRHLQREGQDVLDEGNLWIIKNPIKSALKYKREVSHIRTAALVLPWGAALLAFVHPTPILVATCAVAYAQLLIATDCIRLYQWAWPVVVAGAVAFAPVTALPLLVAVHYSNPFVSEGA